MHFQGGLKRLQEEAERLGLVLLDSNLCSVEEVAAAAAAGSHQPFPHTRLVRDGISSADSLVGAAGADKAVDTDNLQYLDAVRAPGVEASRIKQSGFRGFAKALVGHQADTVAGQRGSPLSSNFALGGSDSIVRRQATLGWSGATMWLFTVGGFYGCVHMCISHFAQLPCGHTTSRYARPNLE